MGNNNTIPTPSFSKLCVSLARGDWNLQLGILGQGWEICTCPAIVWNAWIVDSGDLFVAARISCSSNT